MEAKVAEFESGYYASYLCSCTKDDLCFGCKMVNELQLDQSLKKKRLKP